MIGLLKRTTFFVSLRPIVEFDLLLTKSWAFQLNANSTNLEPESSCSFEPETVRISQEAVQSQQLSICR